MKQIFQISAICMMAISTAMTGQVDASPFIPSAPIGLNPGDSYRMVFVTAGTRDALSTDIADYNAFVDGEAGLLSPDGLTNLTWTAIASTDAVDARDNTGTTALIGLPIFRVDGALVASDYAELWGGSITAPILLDQAGVVQDVFVWTGSGPDGRKDPSLSLGHAGGRGWVGKSLFWMQFTGRSLSEPNHFYGMSEVLTVPTSVVPEPATITLMGIGIVGLGGFHYRRKRKYPSHS